MRQKNERYTKAELGEVVRTSSNWGEVCEKMNAVPTPCSRLYLRKKAEDFGLDWTHFPGSGRRRGKTFTPKRPIEDYLSNTFPIKSGELRGRLIKEGIKQEKCELCGRTEWEGGKIPLELDHINSNHFDNTLENLQIICPNCHAVETASRAKARRKYKSRAEAARESYWREPASCLKCGGPVGKKSKTGLCGSCYSTPKKIGWPSDEELRAMLAESNFLQVAKKLGVTDNAIRNHLGLKKKENNVVGVGHTNSPARSLRPV